MPIFNERAFHAAAEGKDLSWLGPNHLTDWPGLAQALDRLCPEQRCDAIYADWLLQLNSPARQALLQVRNLLIGQGALAANYLAELAQNADDASDGKPAEIRIVLDSDWLFASNSGRKVTSLNLLGLCRFFVHAAGQVVELNDQTIGRFGIGFKSCYRIASEVIVFTWDHEGESGFRLPICREGDIVSEPDRERLERLLARLVAGGIGQLDAELHDIRCLGYCTPEFLSELHLTLAERTEALRKTSRGTLFCFHLRPERRGGVASRITGQERELYELCPLFLPNLRVVQLAHHELQMSVSGSDIAHVVPGIVEANKVTLTTRDLSEPNADLSKSRFWRLRGAAPGDLWQVALHADSSFRLRVGKEDDEQGTSIKDGSAYAFFPLNSVSWPLRLHLHLKLPTNLARDDWNPDDAPQVREQLRRAIRGLAEWIERHPDKRHADWRLEDLVERVPEQNELWARAVWEALLLEAKSRRVLRTLDGSFVSADDAVSIELLDKGEARRAWAVLLGAHPGQPVVEARPSVSFGVQALNPDEVADYLIGMTDWASAAAELRQSLLQAALGCCRTTTPMLERVLEHISVELASGGTAPIRELVRQPGGAELTAEWHTVFRRLASWAADDAPWRHTSVFGGAVEAAVRKLEKPEFNPTWEEVTRRMTDEAAWRQWGEKFWASKRLQCPQGLQNGVLACLRVPVGNQRWLPLSGSWLLDDTVPGCLDLLFSRITDESRPTIHKQLRGWDLIDLWVGQTETRIRDLLPVRLLERLVSRASGDAFLATFSGQFDELLHRLPGGISREVSDAAKTASSRFVRARVDEEELEDKTLVTLDVTAPLRAALCLLPKWKLAPPWLTPAARQRLDAFGLTGGLSFRVLGMKEVKEQQGQLIRELLEEFHQWKESEATPDALAGLEQMAASVARTNRRNWAVGFSPQKKPLLKELILTQSAEPAVSLAEQLNQLLLAKVDAWRNAYRLPPLLAKIPSLAGACAQPHTLTLKLPAVTLTAIERGQILPAALEEPIVRGLVEAGMHSYFTTAPPLKLLWLQDGEVVATLPAADYVVDGDKLIFAHSLPPADEEQFRTVLAIYERSDNPTIEYQRDKDSGASSSARYQSHRSQITKVLLEKEVRAVGYGREHVLRELLQNTESAYASKAVLPPEPWFRFTVERQAQTDVCQVSVSHVGRAFDEPDKDGKKRPDVERIVKVNAPNQNTEDEVGKFNKGFKSLFCVARNQLVHIRSGGYDFKVQDLLLRVPPNPERNLADRNPETLFTFDTSTTDAWAMLGFDQPAPATAAPNVLNASSFVFLRYLRRVTVTFAGREWVWRIIPKAETDGWEKVTVDAGIGRSAEVFLVFRGRHDDSLGRHYAVALRLGKDGLPTKLDQDWRTLRLTFETEKKFNLDVLVNGQFEAEQGRRELVKVAESGLVDAALNAVVTRCETELKRENSKPRWLAWARVLSLSNGLEALKDHARSFENISKRVEQLLTDQIPHGIAIKPLGQLVFPTGLMRELLKEKHAERWGIPSAEWIDPEIEKELPTSDRAKFSFDEWLGRQPPLSPLLRSIQRDLETEAFKALARRFTSPQKQELEKARRILEEKLRPVVSPTPAERPPDPREEWSVADLWHWWEHRRDRDRQDYTLDGANWSLLFSGDSRPSEEHAAHLRATLRDVETDSGRALWYRIMSLACLMSAGRRMSELRGFWGQELESRGFWSETSGKAFGQGTDAMFDALLRRRFSNVAASGEDAHFWRRVFYDVRKIHRLVWGEYKFAEVLLQLARSPERGTELLTFLRSGQLAGQPAWEGVFGQSAGVPLFFLVRELRRLRVIENPTLDPFAFFACAPVRRAAWRLCWLDEDMVRRTDFGSLANASELLHRKISSDREHGAKLLVDYDIPLLHFGLTQ